MSRRYAVTLSLLLVAGLVLAGCALLEQPPVARFTASVLTGTSPLTVLFDASASSDPDGGTLTYLWTFGDGTTSTAETVSHTFTTAVKKTFTVTLRVTDASGASATRSQSIEVLAGSLPGNSAPTARFSMNPSYGDTPLTVSFDASQSSDPDGTIATYGWDFGDDTTGSGKTISHQFTALVTTNYTVTLTVIDNHGGVGVTSYVVTVMVPTSVPDDGPTAEFTASDPDKIYDSTDLPSVPSLFEVTFDPAGSVAAPGHEIKSYVWAFGDGGSETLTTDDPVAHTYASTVPSRSYVVTLTVIDDQGLSHVALRNVTVVQ
jgi:PKD repeat protein